MIFGLNVIWSASIFFKLSDSSWKFKWFFLENEKDTNKNAYKNNNTEEETDENSENSCFPWEMYILPYHLLRLRCCDNIYFLVIFTEILFLYLIWDLCFEVFPDGLFLSHIVENTNGFFGNKLIFFSHFFRLNGHLEDLLLYHFQTIKEISPLFIKFLSWAFIIEWSQLINDMMLLLLKDLKLRIGRQ